MLERPLSSVKNAGGCGERSPQQKTEVRGGWVAVSVWPEHGGTRVRLCSRRWKVPEETGFRWTPFCLTIQTQINPLL